MDEETLHADLFIARKSCKQMRGSVLLARTFDDQWLLQVRKAAATASAALKDEECRAHSPPSWRTPRSYARQGAPTSGRDHEA